MKTGKKIAVGLAAALVVAIFAAGAVSMVGAQLTEELAFTVEVRAFDVQLVINDTDFGEVLPGTTREIHSFDVINAGIIDAEVEAKFLTEFDGIYGLTGGSVIAAEKFMLNDVALNTDGTAKVICTASSEETTPHNAKLFVPIDQPDAAYSGTVELIFTPAIPEE